MPRRPRNSYFECLQFRIEQTDAAMKVTTDACVLGCWPDLQGAQRLLDIGTGTGLLALFAAQRCAAQIDAVELDPQAARQAQANFSASPWAARLQVHEIDIRQFDPGIGYERILCNPPFFSDSTRNRCDRLAQARHDHQLPLADLVTALQRLLTPEGIAYLLLPLEASSRLLSLATQQGLHLSHRLALRNSAQHAPHRLILGLSPMPRALHTAELILYTAHPVHTRAAAELFAPFYTRLRVADTEALAGDLAITRNDRDSSTK